ncbi:isochorismatase family protein [Acidicapsa dinghuensis]|uniref:Isochorismatase family protein n=1 Tax=Acidicapsa dinghuensis TaxID=2218256 RepID=A0ABW1EEY6_9BACT
MPSPGPHPNRLKLGASTLLRQQKLIFAGLSLEVCAALPAMTAVSKGFDAYVPVDACGSFSETKHQTGILRMVQAGVVVSDYCTLMVEILKDNLVPEAGPGRMSSFPRQRKQRSKRH